MRNLFRISDSETITEKNINKYIDLALPELARRKKLYDYYLGRHAILNRTYSDTTKPNNRVVSPYAHYITDFSVGYFVGSPVRYNCSDEIQDEIDRVIKYNDDPAVNSDIAKNCSITGYGYEIDYIDKYGEYRYMSIDSTTMFAIYNQELDNELRYAIRLYTLLDITTHREIHYAEVYDKLKVYTYRAQAGTVYNLVDERLHMMGDIPIIEYVNNQEGLGDFELVMSLIDAYDSVISDEINESAEFADAYLMLKGMMGTESDDITEMKKNRVLLIDSDADASWLTKTADATNSENIKNRLDNEIHIFSGVPNVSDTSFAANASGVAIKYKLIGLEDITGKKETEFRKGLVRRFEILSEYSGMIGSDFDFRDINIVFTRNLPSNASETATLISQLGNVLSTETKLEMLPLDIDVQQELERLNSEKSRAIGSVIDLYGTDE